MAVNVCIIDDDMVSQFATRYRIEQSENAYSVVTYDTAEECLQVLEVAIASDQKIPEIILLDLVMPGMSGWEFLDEIQLICKGLKDIEVYVLSAFNNSKDRDRAKIHPLIKGYFDKPLSKVNVDKIFSSRMV